MAVEGEELPDYHLQAEQPRGPEIIPARGGHLRQIFLNAGHALMLWGALAVVSTTVGNRNPAANATHAFIGFLAWILGVSLLALLPVANRFFAPALLIGVALASSFFKYFLATMELA